MQTTHPVHRWVGEREAWVKRSNHPMGKVDELNVDAELVLIDRSCSEIRLSRREVVILFEVV